MLSRTTKSDSWRFLFLLPITWSAASCTAGKVLVGEDAGSSSSSSSSSGDFGPCGRDCSELPTAPCLMAVCNTGDLPGPIYSCVAVPAPSTRPCDDGKFCTVSDHCQDGVCVGGDANRCGIKPEPCASILCYEELKSCDVTPAGDGTPCTPKNLCQTSGTCQVGQCIGQAKDCSFSPLAECNLMKCDPATGNCIGTRDVTKNNAPCVLSGDPCKVNKTCLEGVCVGGVPKDCSALDVGCDKGVCNAANGLCKTEPAPEGTGCTPGTAECQVGTCNDKGACIAKAAPDGAACNDFNSCTQANKCVAGSCSAGMAVSGCMAYLHEGFENCTNGWTLGGDWECGKPAVVGPPAAYLGSGAVATQIAGLYHVNQSFNTAVADTPTINLTAATNPMVSFWAWDHTEGDSFDGWNLKVSEDGGQTYQQVTTVTPPYDLMILGQPAWGGNHSAEGWRNFMADLTQYKGKSIKLRYAFRSDGATLKPGVYIDEVIVAEPMLIPLFITTGATLPDIYTSMSYSAPIAKIGGTAMNSVWSIKPGGKNTTWMTIDPATGTLSGVPTPADAGPVVVTVHVEEQGLPSNFAEKTFYFNVKPNVYYTSFEGPCMSNGWTLTGDWECGEPTVVGPPKAYIGTQCLATQIDGNYTDNQKFDLTTATSPEIDLKNVTSAMLTFWMWVNTEGGTYDGMNLKISVDGGMNYTLVDGVSPPYPLLIDGQPAWGGPQNTLGWQFVQADLSPFAGQKVRLRFNFRSDSSNVFPGVYIDDLLID